MTHGVQKKENLNHDKKNVTSKFQCQHSLPCKIQFWQLYPQETKLIKAAIPYLLIRTIFGGSAYRTIKRLEEQFPLGCTF